jgi:hypothetical protein
LAKKSEQFVAAPSYKPQLTEVSRAARDERRIEPNQLYLLNLRDNNKVAQI